MGKTIEDVDRVLEEYRQRFGEGFPSMNFVVGDEQHFYDLVKACLDSGKTAREQYNFDADGEDAQY